jgi:hypothetical protein
VDVSGALVGEQWQIGTAILEVSQPRVPCYKLGIRMADPHFPRRFAAAERPGAYLRIDRRAGRARIPCGSHARVALARGAGVVRRVA